MAFGFIETNEEFLTISDYGISFTNSNETGIRNFYGEGFISEKGKVPETDWKEYIKAIVTHTYEELIGEIDPAVYDDKGKFSATLWRTKSDQNLGMLNRNSKKGWDKIGKINEKYEIITTYFKEKYDIDLQAIGNGQKLNK